MLSSSAFIKDQRHSTIYGIVCFSVLYFSRLVLFSITIVTFIFQWKSSQFAKVHDRVLLRNKFVRSLLLDPLSKSISAISQCNDEISVRLQDVLVRPI